MHRSSENYENDFKISYPALSDSSHELDGEVTSSVVGETIPKLCNDKIGKHCIYNEQRKNKY